MEGGGGFADDGHDGDAEEPQAQGPEEGAGGDGEDLQDAAVVGRAVGEGLKVLREALGHADEGEAGEGGRADADEEAGAVLAVWQAGFHQAADVVGVHHAADGEAEALEGDAGGDDGDCGSRRLVFGDDGGDSAAKHDGEGREDPRRHHRLEPVGDAGEDVGVLDYGQGDGAGAVDPEEDFEGYEVGFRRVGAEVAVQAGDDGCDG